MNSKQIEVEMLLDIYEMDINTGESIHYTDYQLEEGSNSEKVQELGMHLLRPKRFKYIDFDEKKAFTKDGMLSERYRNNIIMVFSEKMKHEAKDLVKKVYEEVKDITSKSIPEYFATITKK